MLTIPLWVSLLIVGLIVSNPITSVSGQSIIKIGSKDNSINHYLESFGLKAVVHALKKQGEQKMMQ